MGNIQNQPIGDLRPYLVAILKPWGIDEVNGTGFFCHPDGYVLTCWHVIENHLLQGITEINLSKKGYPPLKALICSELSSPQADIAVLKVNQQTDPWPYLPLDIHNRVKARDNVRSFGYPEGHFASGVEILGQIGATPSEFEKIEVLRVEGLSLDNINGGYSGAPVLSDVTQKVVGLIRVKHTDTQGFFTAIGPLFQTWPQLNEFHDVYQYLRQYLANDAQNALRKGLKKTPFISMRLEEGTLPKRTEHATTLDYSKPQEAVTGAQGRNWEKLDLNQLLPPKGRYLLSSEVGSGKTTFVYWLANELIHRTSDIVPLVISCVQLKATEATHWQELKELLINSYDCFLRKDVEDFLEWAYERRNIVFLFDALDQIGGRYYEFANETAYSIAKENAVLITSRPSATLRLQDDSSIRILKLRPFSPNDQRLYFGETYDEAMKIAEMAIELSQIPMLAYMIRALIMKGMTTGLETRTEIYQKYMNYIFLNHESIATLSKEDPALAWEVECGLRTVAYQALVLPKPQIQRIEKSLVFKLVKQPESLLRFGLVNTIFDGDMLFYSFTHQSFQEFLAAQYLVEDGHEDQIRHVLTERWNIKWEQVIRFLVGLKGEDILKALVKDNDNVIHSDLFFMASCFPETKAVSPITRKRLERELIPLLGRSALPFYEDALEVAIPLGLVESSNTRLINREIECLGDETLGRDKIAVNHLLRAQLTVSHVDMLIEVLAKGSRNARFGALKVLLSSNRQLTQTQVTTLVSFLANDNREAHIAALHVLNGLDERLTPIQIDHLIGMLANGNSQVRNDVAEALELLGDRINPTQVNSLVKLLKDEDPDVRYATVRALGRLGGCLLPNHFDILLQRLEDENADVRYGVLKAFGQLGKRLPPAYIDIVIELLKDEDRKMREEALRALARFDGLMNPAQIDFIVDLLNDKDRNVRFEALRALEALDKGLLPSHIDPLILRLSNKKAEEQLVDTLGALAGKLTDGQVDTLFNRLEDPHQEVRYKAISVLLNLGERLSSAQIDTIIDRLEDKSIVRFTVADSLEKLSSRLTQTQIDILLKKLNGYDKNIRYMVIDAIGKWDGHLTVMQADILEKCLENKDWEVRESAVKAIGHLCKHLASEYMNSLMKRLDDQNAFVRRTTVEALGQWGEFLTLTQVNNLIERLGDMQSDVGEAAINVVAGLGNRLTSTQIEILENGMGDNDEYGHVQWNSYEVLKKLYRAGIPLPTLN